MNTLNIIIIDDDNNAIFETQKNCELYLNQSNIPFHIQSFDDPQLFFNQSIENIDLLLLDIEMPSINGIELATKVRSKNKTCFICFITNYTDYLYQSYDVHAFDYILKPVTKDKIFALLDDILKYREQKKTHTKLSFYSTTGKIVLNQNDIYYFEYYDKLNNLFNRVTKVYTTSGEYILKEKISDILNSLPQKDFVVPHKSFIINMDQIKQMKQSEIIMQNNACIPLSQKRAADIRKKFNDYLNSL